MHWVLNRVSKDSTNLEGLIDQGYRFAFALTHNSACAEDLLQDAWVSVLRSGGPWSKRYLFAAIRSRFIDGHRMESRGPSINNDQPGFDVCKTEMKQECDENGTLEKALGQLDPESRSMLYLAAVENWTTREIAVSMGMPRGTVLSRLHRTRMQLRRIIEDLDSDEKI